MQADATYKKNSELKEDKQKREKKELVVSLTSKKKKQSLTF